MLNPLLLSSPDADDRPFAVFVVLSLLVFAANGIYASTIDPASSPTSGNESGVAVQENMTIRDTDLLVLQNGETDEVEVRLDSNYSDDGWVLIRIETLVSYGETTAADAACDTVSVDLSLNDGGGDEPENSITEGQANDCGDLILWMDWPSLENTDTKHPAAPLSAVVTVTLDVQSTIPFNDQDENVEVDIMLTLARIQIQ